MQPHILKSLADDVVLCYLKKNFTPHVRFASKITYIFIEGHDAQGIADRLAAASGLTLSRDAVYRRMSRMMKRLRNYGR